MINIVERPSKTGKLIHLNPQDWNTAVRIHKALSKEEHATEEHGQYDTPDRYPIGTVAELWATEFGVTYYLIKQANGSWRQITPASSAPPSPSSITQTTTRAIPMMNPVR